MAKKQKQKKAGMQKRKQMKDNRKSQQRRMGASRTPKRPTSEREIEKILQKIPVLAFEEEFQPLHFKPEQLQAFEDGATSEPDIIAALANEDFMARLKLGLEKMEERVQNNTTKILMIKGLTYAVSSNEVPIFINPLVVAIYFRSLALIKQAAFTPQQAIDAVTAYETRHHEILQERMNEMAASEQTEDDFFVEGTEDEDIIDGELVSSPEYQAEVRIRDLFAPIIDAFEQVLQDKSAEEVEYILEDSEVFLIDYIRAPFNEWKPGAVKQFNQWFADNMNPIAEDLQRVPQSLKTLLEYLSRQGHIEEGLAKQLITELK